MRGLFQVFDPSTQGGIGLSLNWMAILGFIFLPSHFWLGKNKNRILLHSLLRRLAIEIKVNSRLSFLNSIPLFLCRVFVLVLRRNFLGLLPYVFTASSHLCFTLVLACSSWVGYVIYRRVLNPSNFFSHLVPRGTPIVLVPFIVLIETVRRLIRPFTLAVRLAANIVAGHLLLVLVRTPLPTLPPLALSIGLRGVFLLITLEIGVSFIQSYVFISLSSLYAGEVNAPNL